jgi:hypothetical protein
MKTKHLLSVITLSLVSTAMVAHADTFPKRKSGLWAINVSITGQPPHDMKQCVDEKTDAVIEQVIGDLGKMCPKKDIVPTGSGYTIESVCNVGNSKVTSHGKITGDFQSKYVVETSSSYEPPLLGIKEGTSMIIASWTGPCEAGQNPGDIILPGGAKMNVNDMKVPTK